MPDVSLGGNLPVGDHDGLTAIASDLIEEPRKLRAMIAVVDTQKITTKTDDGSRTAVVRIRRIEAILAEDLGTAEKLMRRALEKRTGRTTLPLDLEDELEQAFADIDPGDDEPGDAAEEAGGEGS